MRKTERKNNRRTYAVRHKDRRVIKTDSSRNKRLCERDREIEPEPHRHTEVHTVESIIRKFQSIGSPIKRNAEDDGHLETGKRVRGREGVIDGLSVANVG